MKLHLRSEYKSLLPFQVDLPDFTVLTGLNGSGKTHLLMAIAENILVVEDIELRVPVKIKHITLQDLVPDDNLGVRKEKVYIDPQRLWGLLQNLLPVYSEMNKAGKSMDLLRVNKYKNGPGGENTSLTYSIIKIAEQAKKSYEDLIIDDFVNYRPLEIDFTENNIFKKNLSVLFKEYQVRFEDNEYREFRNKSKGMADEPFLSKEEFVASFGEAPWDVLNMLLDKMGFNYNVSSPINDSREKPFEARLIDLDSRVNIKFGDLSSGEKVLMSFFLALYNPNANFDNKLPNLLLMDEPDAYLHPSMSKQLINIIQNIFVNEMKMKVIITTHSPSTIAFAPEDSLYTVNKYGSKIEKVSKDKALRILTIGVPSFSVNYENRRQIFVESDNDVDYYERLYYIFSSLLNPDISLSFISSGDSKTNKNGIGIANCGQVINITKLLREKGNKFVWGIIDWDLNNQDSDSIKVLGLEKRYSIENYILDPLLVAALLWKRAFVSADDLGLSKSDRYLNILSFSNTKLQLLINYVISNLADHLNQTDAESQNVRLVNDMELSIPIWFLRYQGHQLEEALLIVFPKLNEIKKKQEKLLKLAILDEVAADAVELLSIDLLNVLLAVQSV